MWAGHRSRRRLCVRVKVLYQPPFPLFVEGLKPVRPILVICAVRPSGIQHVPSLMEASYAQELHLDRQVCGSRH